MYSLWCTKKLCTFVLNVTHIHLMYHSMYSVSLFLSPCICSYMICTYVKHVLSSHMSLTGNSLHRNDLAVNLSRSLNARRKCVRQTNAWHIFHKLIGISDDYHTDCFFGGGGWWFSGWLGGWTLYGNASMHCVHVNRFGNLWSSVNAISASARREWNN